MSSTSKVMLTRAVCNILEEISTSDTELSDAFSSDGWPELKVAFDTGSAEQIETTVKAAVQNDEHDDIIQAILGHYNN